MVQRRGDGLSQLRLAHPSGTVKDEGEGAQGVPLAGVGPQLEGGGHHGPLLAQYAALEVLVQRLEGGGRSGSAAQRLETVRHGLKPGKALHAPLGEKAAQAGVVPGVGHGGTEIEQIVRPLPPEAQTSPSGAAAGRHLAGGELVAAAQPGAGVHPLLQQDAAGRNAGAKLREIHVGPPNTGFSVIIATEREAQPPKRHKKAGPRRGLRKEVLSSAFG